MGGAAGGASEWGPGGDRAESQHGVWSRRRGWERGRRGQGCPREEQGGSAAPSMGSSLTGTARALPEHRMEAYFGPLIIKRTLKY